jgi:Rieske Fe-S protein
MTFSAADGISRRGVLAGAAGVAAIGATALTACGTSDDAGDTGANGAGVTVKAEDVPVGSAAIVGQVVVSQLTAGDFKAFSAVCTHQQCLVSRVQGHTVICTCHQSTYSAKDGSVISGPAPFPLPARTVTQSGDSLTIT